MKITFTSPQFEITDAMRQFAQEKFDRLYRHFNRITSINLTFLMEKLDNIAEATIHIPGESFHASSRSTDIYSAIDTLIDKLDRQLKRHKEKEDEHR
jgi:putative sigma-54 modulation protein